MNEETGQVEIKFVKSEENKADIFTKNVSKDIMDRHTKEFLVEKEEVDDL